MNIKQLRSDLTSQVEMVVTAQGDMNALCIRQGQGGMWQIENELREVNKMVEDVVAWCDEEIKRAESRRKISLIQAAILGSIHSLLAITVEINKVISGTWVESVNK